MAAGVHLIVMIVGVCSAGLGGMILAGILAGFRPMDSDFVVTHARASFNVSSTLLACSLLAILIPFIVHDTPVVIFLIPIVLSLVFLFSAIMAANRAVEGKTYQYPFSIPFL